MDLFAKVRGYDRQELASRLTEAGMLPYFRVLQSPPTAVARMDGRDRVLLGSSNYLGLSGDARVSAAAQRACTEYGTSLNGSRLMNGSTPLHRELEEAVAGWLGEADALVFASGYTANLGVIAALVGPHDVALCDAEDHASILDGGTLAHGKVLRFRHNEVGDLERRLAAATGDDRGALVVVDAVYSMRGDVTDVAATAKVAGAYGARLLVDEAHAIGVLGPAGTGVSALAGIAGDVDLRMGTFSKALAGGGGFVAGPAEVIDYLRLHSRAFLFTAATPAAQVGAALQGVEIARGAEGDRRRAALAANARRLRAGLAELGLLRDDPGGIESPILAVPMADEVAAVLAWNQLYDAGVYVNVAVPPAVPRGTAQLRVSVMATHRPEHLDRALDAFATLAHTLRDSAACPNQLAAPA
jgi:8-amino-7-oxononanoate synthase